MKMVLNKAFGGFGCYIDNEEVQAVIGKYEDEENRNNAELVECVESHPGECGDLRVVEISDEATDWVITEYDGWESVTYVVDGKIHWA
jgi:hypothetical protein